MGPWVEWFRREWALFFFWLVMVLIYSALSVLRHWHFGSSGFDLGIFDQVLWHYSRFERPSSTISPHLNILGDHFHPLLALLAPLYWVAPHVEVLLCAQAVLLMLPIFPLFFFACERIGRKQAFFFTAAYAIFGGVQSAAEYDFHEVSLAVPLAAFAVYFMAAKRWKIFFVCVFLLMMVKEDMCLLSVFFGILLFIRGERPKGMALAGFSALLFILETRVFIPFFADPGKGWSYWCYSRLGAGPLEALVTFLSRPWVVLGLLFSDPRKVWTFIWIFGAFLFFPFRSWLVLLSVPLVFEKLLSDNPNHWGMGFHYSAVLSPIVAFAAVEGFLVLFRSVRPEKRRVRWMAFFSAFVFFLNFAMLPATHLSPLSSLMRPSWYRMTRNDMAGLKAMEMIPVHASVLAQDRVVPHLSHREAIRNICPENILHSRAEDYVIACSGMNPWPLENFKEIEKCLEAREKSGYRRIFNEAGWVVLERTSGI